MSHVRIKARVPTALWNEVRTFADAAGCSIEEWTHHVCRDYARGKFGVTKSTESEKGTRAKSVTAYVRVPENFDMKTLRIALRAGVEYMRPRLYIPQPIIFNGFAIGGRGASFSITKIEGEK